MSGYTLHPVVVLKVLWWGLALVAVAFAVGVAMSPVGDVSLACSKSGDLGLGDGQASWQCDDSIVDVLGFWPLVQLGLVLALPPVVAAVTMRRWVAWLVAMAFVVLTLVGIANWSGFWISLWFAIPMGIASAVIALVQQVVSAAQRPAGRVAR